MNVFGVPGVEADFEIFSAIVDIMGAFGANETMYKVKYSDRRIISALLSDFLKLDAEKQVATRRLMDKRPKVTKEEFVVMLTKIGITGKTADAIEAFMTSTFATLPKVIPTEILSTNEGYLNVQKLETLLAEYDILKFCEFDPGIIRGFDYSDGLVYEVFDTNPENRRSMFGGERFDRLINVYGKYEMAATGFAMGDITLLEFLKGWNLLPEMPSTTKVLVTVFSPNSVKESILFAKELRSAGVTVDLYTTPDKLEKQLKYADKKGIRYVAILGEDEIQSGTVMLKDMKEKKQEKVKREDLAKLLNN
jgi:histidyl-tRNA synthetase